jgi:hypothetical protein
MTTTSYKILGQSAPAATTETALYTVPSATETIISTITVCNRGSSAATYRIYVADNGAATANAQYVVYDASILAKETIALTLGVALNASDVLRVYASSADLSFNAFGTEIA